MKLTTAGESHGKELLAILEGFPAGLVLDMGAVDAVLALRQGGYGRGNRQLIEHDHAEILSGVRGGMTIGSPIAVRIVNRDHRNWESAMSPEDGDLSLARVTAVRPGHADLPGMLKYGWKDARNVLERASARETAVRVAAGELCRQLLAALGIEVRGYVRASGTVSDPAEYPFEELSRRSPRLGMMDPRLEKLAMEEIDSCAAEGDTLGGVAEVRAKGLKSGFGSCMTASERLDGRIAASMMSVQAVKGVEFGLGFEAAKRRGSAVHDEIFYQNGYRRATNRAGGIEGGMSNGEEIVVRLAMKPIPTLKRGLRTVDAETGLATFAAAERSDVSAIFALETVAESVLALTLAEVVCERLGGDTVDQFVRRYGELP